MERLARTPLRIPLLLWASFGLGVTSSLFPGLLQMIGGVLAVLPVLVILAGVIAGARRGAPRRQQP